MYLDGFCKFLVILVKKYYFFLPLFKNFRPIIQFLAKNLTISIDSLYTFLSKNVYFPILYLIDFLSQDKNYFHKTLQDCEDGNILQLVSDQLCRSPQCRNVIIVCRYSPRRPRRCIAFKLNRSQLSVVCRFGQNGELVNQLA